MEIHCNRAFLDASFKKLMQATMNVRPVPNPVSPTRIKLPGCNDLKRSGSELPSMKTDWRSPIGLKWRNSNHCILWFGVDYLGRGMPRLGRGSASQTSIDPGFSDPRHQEANKPPDSQCQCAQCEPSF